MNTLTTSEAAAATGINPRTLQRAVATGELRGTMRAGTLFISARSLDKYVAAKADRLSRRGRKPKGSPAPR